MAKNKRVSSLFSPRKHPAGLQKILDEVREFEALLRRFPKITREMLNKEITL